MRRLVGAAVSEQHRTLTLVVGVALVASFVAMGTGFWLLFRLTYVVALALPICWTVAWWNTRHVEGTVERRTDRAQVGQEAVEVIEIRNRDFLPKMWLPAQDPSDLPRPRPRPGFIVPPPP